LSGGRTLETGPDVNSDGTPLSIVDTEAYRSLMRFRMLGPLEVTDGGHRLSLGGPKQRLVLAHLLIRANQVASADLLIDEIWGDEPPEAARASLQSYVSHLRKALGGERLQRRSSGYLLRAAPEEIDAVRFETLVSRARRTVASDPRTTARLLREALGLWQGAALADLSDELSVQAEIERLSGMRLGALEDRIEADLALGRHTEIVAELESEQAGNPLRERLCGELMLALYRSGRQADALAAYHRLRRALDDELGVDPSPALDALQRRILNHDPALELRGEPLRGYRLLERIGAGRLGSVHRAFEPQANREVAIKILGARTANRQDFVRRFEAEARRVARLEHPHVAPLYDWWREPDAAYLVMRLMRGGSLTERIDSADITTAEALLWTEQIGSALTAAHRHGVVHGDLRSSKVLLDDDGNAYLSDFVLGYEPATDGRVAQRPSAVAHLAPERQAGGPPSSAADVYAFGVLIGQLLDAATAKDPPTELHAALAPALSSVAADRPPTATAVSDGVRRALLAPAAPGSLVGDPERLTRNPYKGLRAFEEADATDFFGREALVARLIATMGESTDASRLLAVVGPSGSGKSSVVDAGLLPAVRAGAVAGSDQWFVASMTPQDRPFDQLERALLAVGVDAPASMAELLEADDGLREATARLLPPSGQLLLIIDQFEELFTLVSDEATRERFLSVMAQAIGDPASPVRIVITLRADFYDRPLRHERFGRQLALRTVPVPPLTPEELERAVAAPAERVGLQLEPGLVARMVAEMSQKPGALPLLQYALTELWERREGPRLSLHAYDASGGIAAAVGRRAEELVVQLDSDGRETARQLFLRLVELGEGTADTARRVLRSQLDALPTDQERMEAVIERFARYRLLLLDRDPETRGPTLELAHEALLHAWPRLQAWIDEARDDLRSQRRLSAAAVQWVDGEREVSFLLSGARLEQTEHWAGATRMLLTQAEREFLAASLAERDRTVAEDELRRARERALERRAMTRLRGLVLALGIGALLAGGLSLFALSESGRAAQETRIATARELAAASVANLAVDPERSILLALEAVAVTRTVDGTVLPEAEDALHRAVTASRIVLRVPGVGGALAWSPDGSIFVTEGPEDSGLLDIRSAVTGEPMLPAWHGHDVDVNDVAFSPDGSLLLTTGDDGTAAVWDPATGRLQYRVSGTGQVWGPTFSPDGSRAAAVWSEEDVLRVWDAATGEAIPNGEVVVEGTPTGASFNADGSSLAITLRGPAVVVLDLASGELLPFALEHGIFAFDAAWSPDGRWLATAGRVPAVRIWDAKTGDLKFDLPAHGGDASLVRWSPDSTRLATGASDGSVKVWQVAEHGADEILSLSGLDTASGIAGLAFSPDGDHLMTGDWAITGVQIWDVRPDGEAEWPTLVRGAAAQGAVAFAPDGRLVASLSEGQVVIREARTIEELGLLGHGEDTAPGIAVSPDGALVAAAGGEDDTARVWQMASGDDVFEVPHDAAVLTVNWSPEGTLLAMGDDAGQVTIVDRSGEVVRVLSDPESEILMVRFSPDGRLLAVVREFGPWSVAIWDWEASEMRVELPFAARDVAFDSTGTRIATAGIGGPDVVIWETESGQELQTLTGEVAQLWGLAWSADDSRIAAGGFDGPVRLWDVQAGVEALVLRGHIAPVNGLAFSPDGSQLASTSVDGTVRVWALDLDDLIGIALNKLQRGLSDPECRQYLHIESCLPPE
jgi:WD40 repeat protein/DNA-binding SARP family transcriptional activator